MPSFLALLDPPGSTFWVQALVFVALVALSGLFSGSELAFLTLNRLRRRQLEEEQHPRIGAVQALLARPQRFLATILIANNLVNIAAASLATSMAIEIAGSRGVALATGVTTFLILTFGEVTPKAYATQHNERMALRLAPFILLLQRILYPVVRAYEAFTLWLLKRFGAKDVSAAAQQIVSEEELMTMISVGAEEGVIEESEEAMLHSVIELGDTIVKEIMVPRIDVIAVSGDKTLDAVRGYVMESGHSRIPVYDGTVDNITGILYVRDFLSRLVGDHGELHVRDIMREAYFVPEVKRVAGLLAEMREKRVHMAVVLDEFGGTAGIVTMEDVLEEIVGEIFDEYDLRQEPVRRLDARTAIVDARTPVDDVNEVLGTHIPEDEPYETLGGFLSHSLGHLGREGERVTLDGTEFIVDRGTHRRILRVRVVQHEPASGEGDANAA